jgi:hypothetical protein
MSLSGILKTVTLATIAGVVVANLITSKSSSGSVVARMLGKRGDDSKRFGTNRNQGADLSTSELRSPL